MSELASDALRRYYDALSRRLLFRRRLGAGEGAEHLTMHRALVDPERPDGPPSQLTLERLIEDAIDWPPDGAPFRAVDLGCGYGGLALRLSARRGGAWLGLTLSPVQAARASQAARRRRLEQRARFVVRSYDAPFSSEERFDVAIAVESLIHSADKRATLRNVAAGLKPGATLAIVDDVAADASPQGPQIVEAMAAFQTGWLAPSAPDEAAWREALADAGLIVARIDDLTPLMRPRSDLALAKRAAAVASRRRRALGRNRRALLDGEIGGLALERLYNAGAMRYLMICARKA